MYNNALEGAVTQALGSAEKMNMTDTMASTFSRKSRKSIAPSVTSTLTMQTFIQEPRSLFTSENLPLVFLLFGFFCPPLWIAGSVFFFRPRYDSQPFWGLLNLILLLIAICIVAVAVGVALSLRGGQALPPSITEAVLADNCGYDTRAGLCTKARNQGFMFASGCQLVSVANSCGSLIKIACGPDCTRCSADTDCGALVGASSKCVNGACVVGQCDAGLANCDLNEFTGKRCELLMIAAASLERSADCGRSPCFHDQDARPP
jgi:hypothetical protein